MEHFITVLKKYAVFSGRASRAEFWYFYLFSLIFSVSLVVVDMIIDAAGGPAFLNSLFALAIFIPSIAVSVRRMHDIGKSGWNILLSLIPIVGPFLYLALLVRKGDEGENQYGPAATNSQPQSQVQTETMQQIPQQQQEITQEPTLESQTYQQPMNPGFQQGVATQTPDSTVNVTPTDMQQPTEMQPTIQQPTEMQPNMQQTDTQQSTIQQPPTPTAQT